MFRITRKSIETWVNMTGELRLLISISEANQVNSTTVFNDSLNEKKLRTFLILRIEDGGKQIVKITKIKAQFKLYQRNIFSKVNYTNRFFY